MTGEEYGAETPVDAHGVIVQDGAPGSRRPTFPVRLLPATPARDYCALREEPVVRQSRRCSRSGCAQPAAATLTYVYAESTAVVGPLATFSEPHSYDLCEFHAQRLTVPRGWEVVRHEIDLEDSGPTLKRPYNLASTLEGNSLSATLRACLPSDPVTRYFSRAFRETRTHSDSS